MALGKRVAVMKGRSSRGWHARLGSHQSTHHAEGDTESATIKHGDYQQGSQGRWAHLPMTAQVGKASIHFKPFWPWGRGSALTRGSQFQLIRWMLCCEW